MLHIVAWKFTWFKTKPGLVESVEFIFGDVVYVALISSGCEEARACGPREDLLRGIFSISATASLKLLLEVLPFTVSQTHT